MNVWVYSKNRYLHGYHCSYMISAIFSKAKQNPMVSSECLENIPYSKNEPRHRDGLQILLLVPSLKLVDCFWTDQGPQFGQAERLCYNVHT